MAVATTEPRVAVDPRAAAFCSLDAAEVFGSVVQPQTIWKPDPLDVTEIHADARETFATLFHRAGRTPRPDSGKVLVVQGVGGSGKTHLMRAFRHFAHNHGGYCGYLQLISQSQEYMPYILGHLIDSLNHPYLETRGPQPGLTRLARGLLDALEPVTAAERDTFCDEILDPAEAARQVDRFADFAIQDERFDERDLDVIRALLFLLPNDRRVRGRIIKWLRAEDLTPGDRALIGGLAPRTADGAALRTIEGLARVMAAVHDAPLVVLVDQLEDTYDATLDERESGLRFRKAMDAVVNIAAHVPTAVVVVACLEDYYQSARQYLPGTKIDRLEHDPKPARLSATRTPDEIEALLARRLQHLFGAHDVNVDPADPLYPFAPAHLAALAGFSTRAVLQWFHDYQTRCLAAGRVVEPPTHGPPPLPPAVPVIPLQQAWNDFLSAYATPVLDDEPELAAALQWALQTASVELPAGLRVGATVDDRFVETGVELPGGAVDRLLVAVCDKSTRGGGLGRQIQEVAKRVGDWPVVLVRSSDFPKKSSTIWKEIGPLVRPAGKGRTVVVQSSDWRTLYAFREFHQKHHTDAGFTVWQHDAKPLTGVPAVSAILALDQLFVSLPVQVAPVAPADPPVPPAGQPKALPEPPASSGPLLLGETRSLSKEPVTIDPKELTQHMAFLGGPGSGKTTAALALVEQLLARGVPAVLLDRKGDLARYADPDAWQSSPDDPRAAERTALRERIDVAVFTPGEDGGRPMGLSVMPGDLGNAPAAEREELARQAAGVLWQMMGQKGRGTDPRLAILGKALDVLARTNQPVTLPAVRQLVREQDETLTQEAEYDQKHYKKLTDDLQTVVLQKQRLYDAPETLDIDLLLGRGRFAVPGKTRLSVLNTQFLGNEDAADAWVAQLLVALGRWKRTNPSPTLQAVFLFDEADRYLPARGAKPATKDPMEHLLRQVRSAGVGLFLATQSPGDFDYTCRDLIRGWLVGRVREARAHEKLKATLEAAKTDVLPRLAGQQTGEFFFARERDVTPVKTRPSLIETRQVPQERVKELARR